MNDYLSPEVNTDNNNIGQYILSRIFKQNIFKKNKKGSIVEVLFSQNCYICNEY